MLVDAQALAEPRQPGVHLRAGGRAVVLRGRALDGKAVAHRGASAAVLDVAKDGRSAGSRVGAEGGDDLAVPVKALDGGVDRHGEVPPPDGRAKVDGVVRAQVRQALELGAGVLLLLGLRHVEATVVICRICVDPLNLKEVGSGLLGDHLGHHHGVARFHVSHAIVLVSSRENQDQAV